MQTNDSNLEKPENNIATNISALINSTQSCMLATLDAYGSPEASSTPYYIHNNKCVYIFVSDLAAHTSNLKRTSACSVLLCEDESATKNIFARKRLIFKSTAHFIARDSAIFAAVMPAFEAARGKTLALLKSLPDFHLVEIKPITGTYVEGFGAAHSFKEMAFNDAIQEVGK